MTLKKRVSVRNEKTYQFHEKLLSKVQWPTAILKYIANGEGQPLHEKDQTRAGGLLGFRGVRWRGGAKKQKKQKNKTMFLDSLGGGGGCQDSLRIVFLVCLVLLLFLFFWGPPPNPNPHHPLVHQPNPVYFSFNHLPTTLQAPQVFAYFTRYWKASTCKENNYYRLHEKALKIWAKPRCHRLPFCIFWGS